MTQQDYDAVAGPDWPPYHVFVMHQSVPDFVYAELDTMLSPVVEFDHPSFCVLPFYGHEHPQNKPCCFIPTGSNVKQIQQEMLQGLKPTACQKCWNMEDAGLKSDRILKNSTLDFYHNRNIKDLYQECVQGQSSVIHYKIDTNNVCNLTCVTCSSGSSSAWAKLERANGVRPRTTWQTQPQEIDRVIDYKTAKIITFRGGEPFMSQTNWHVLEQLLANNNTDCFISFTTNGSIKLTAKQKNIIKQFTNVNFCFSIDGIDKVFEYMRYPLKFETVTNNIEWCRQNNIDASVSYTLSNLNILYHSQTVAWFEQNNLTYLVNPVYQPAHFRPGALTDSVKQQIIKHNSQDVSAFLQNTDRDHLNYEQFKLEIAKQDSWKNIQLKYYLPELASLLDQ